MSNPAITPNITTSIFIPAKTTAGESFNNICAFTYSAILAKFTTPNAKPAPIFFNCHLVFIRVKYKTDIRMPCKKCKLKTLSGSDIKLFYY